MVYCSLQLVEQLCYPLVHYQITHNVSSDQSPITTNRTNVTLYGVQPGETYTVEITPYVQLRKGEPRTFTFSKALLTIPPILFQYPTVVLLVACFDIFLIVYFNSNRRVDYLL